MQAGQYVDSLVQVYRALVADGKARDSDMLAATRTARADWTEAGARTLTQLVDDYGIFMLRNAPALAEAIEKEDGDESKGIHRCGLPRNEVTDPARSRCRSNPRRDNAVPAVDLRDSFRGRATLSHDFGSDG